MALCPIAVKLHNVTYWYLVMLKIKLLKVNKKKNKSTNQPIAILLAKNSLTEGSLRGSVPSVLVVSRFSYH